MTDTNISIDLNDPRTIKIAEILGNETCKKILKLISEKEMTETDIASELKIPLNTIDYNIKKLVSAGLIESTNHWWSVKGKKMPSYRVAEKKIIISPKTFSSKILAIPILVLTGIGALTIKLFNNSSEISNSVESSTQLLANSPSVASSVAVQDKASSLSVAPASLDAAQRTIESSTGLPGWEWFLIGAWISTILFLIFIFLNERRHTK